MSMDAKGDQERSQRPPLWRIDRFELIFYNGRHNRWQYFAEDPLLRQDYATDRRNLQSEESLHRREIRSLLRTVRDVIGGFARPSPVFALREGETLANSRPIQLAPPLPSRVPLPTWRAYLGYL